MYDCSRLNMALDDWKERCSISTWGNLHVAQCWLVSSVHYSKYPNLFAKWVTTVSFNFAKEE